MAKKLFETLLAFPTEEQVKNVCQPGQGEKTCRYLTAGGRPLWYCAKASSLKAALDERVAKGTMKARGDNCGGLLGLIMDNQEDLVGKKVEYKETMPTCVSNGTFTIMEIKDKFLNLFWKVGEKEENTGYNIDYLGISLIRQSIIFEIAGIGIMGGTVTIDLA